MHRIKQNKIYSPLFSIQFHSNRRFKFKSAWVQNKCYQHYTAFDFSALNHAHLYDSGQVEIIPTYDSGQVEIMPT